MKSFFLRNLFFLLIFLGVGNVYSQQGKILIVGDHDINNAYLLDVFNKISNSGVFDEVDVNDRSQGFPNLSTLLDYDAVLVWGHDQQFTSTFGDDVASYIDEGGGVVTALFSTAYSASSRGMALLGRFQSDEYYLIKSTRQGGNSGFVKVLPNHELLEGVNSFTGAGFSSSNPTVVNNSTVAATWGDGSPLIVFNDDIGLSGAKRVDLDFFPPSSDARGDFWNSSTDGLKILTNALRYVGNPIRATPSSACISSPSIEFSVTTDNVSSISWDFGDSSGVSTQLAPTYSYSNSGSFTVTANVTFNDSTTETYTNSVTVDALPTLADAGVDQTICSGTTATLNGNLITSGEGIWTVVSGPNTPTLTSTSNPATTVSNLVNGTYTFRWTSSNGACASSYDDVIISVGEQNAGSLSGIQNLCLGQSTQFSSTISGGTWASSNSSVAQVDASTGMVTAGSETGTATITYTVTGLNGCSNGTATSLVTVNQPLLPTVSDVAYCTGDTAAALTAIAATGYSLRWYTVATGGTASTMAPTPDVSSSGTATYYVSQVNDTSGCESDRASIVVTVNDLSPLPTVSDVSYCLGETATALTATATDGYSLQWYTTAAGGTASTTAPIPSVSVAGTTRYYVSQKEDLEVIEIKNSRGSLSNNYISTSGSVGQTFTATDNFTLRRLIVRNYTFSGAVNITAKIYDSPSKTTLLGQGDSDYLESGGTANSPVFNFNNSNILLNAGSVYYYELTKTGSGNLRFYDGNAIAGDRYLNGVLQSGSDMYFELSGDAISNSCESPRAEIEVIVADAITPPVVGNTVIETFTTVGQTTWDVPSGVTTVDYLVVGGGGGGGNGFDTGGGGGGAGGMVLTGSLNVVAGQSYTITVGQGGSGGQDIRSNRSGQAGNSTVFHTITALGGLAGGGSRNGGTGNGGAAQIASSNAPIGGAGGGNGSSSVRGSGGGGGGATGNGGNGSSSSGGAGGSGFSSSLSGDEIFYGIGGAGAKGNTNTTGVDGTSNTGNGGGAGGARSNSSRPGGDGATGIVILSYPANTSFEYCVGETANALTATPAAGNTLQWYTSATGGMASSTAPTPDTSSAGTITYYVSQRNSNGCESSRVSIQVTVKSTPVISGDTSVEAGESIILSATTTPASSNAWVSSNPTKATVDANGQVSGLVQGNTVITYTNVNGCSVDYPITVTVGTTQNPVLTLPATNTTGATTLQVDYTLPEAPLSGSVSLSFSPIDGSAATVWTMADVTSVTFDYAVGADPTAITSVVSGNALSFKTYDVTLSYQDAFGSPEASVTNTNIQTLAAPVLSFSEVEYNGIINVALAAITPANTGGTVASYAITPVLPAGVSLDVTTGVISGTPTIGLPQTQFTLTATNGAGSDTATFKLFVDADIDGDGEGDTTDDDMDGDGIPNDDDADADGDGTDENGTDTDGDGTNDAADTDDDNDGVLDADDAFPTDPSEDTDTDGDGEGDNSDDDIDGDGETNDVDTDDDNDGVLDADDAFPSDPSEDTDTDGDGEGDNSDDDIDGDGIPNTDDADINGDGTVDNGTDTDGDGTNDAADADDDNDGVLDADDAFPTDPSEDTDTDGDGEGDNSDDDIDGDGETNDVDTDDDNDGVLDADDAFPTDPTEDTDTDGDGEGDNSDNDIDGDGIPNADDADVDGDGTVDNGTDTDGDGTNDAADTDDDNDGVLDADDAFPTDPSEDTDTDGDGEGDNSDDDIDGDGETNDVDTDDDNDGVLDADDAFPTDPTEDTDTDGDGEGDNSDDDIDGDGIPNADDADVDGDGTNDNGTDTDGDGTNDAADDDIDGDGISNGDDADVDGDGTNDNGTDTDGDGTNDAADNDIDGDGVANSDDAFPTDPSEDKDTDGDGIGDNADADIDGDGVVNTDDAFPLDATEDTDTDGDGIGDNSDTDIDGDGVVNTDDAFPLDDSEDTDTDGDGEGDNSDTDIDGDGVANSDDAFPLDGSEDTDTDGDGEGDNSDTDIDGDGVNNAEDAFPLDPAEDTDTDGDGEGDNSDTDIDGDGIDNDSDSDVDGDGVLDNGTDVDGDGINDANDEPSVGQDIRSYNAVTPNGDGVHDEFMIENLTAYPNNRLQIVNRWGAVVYESQNYGTTGNYFVGEHYQTGEMLPGGVYYYTFQYTTPAGDTQYKQGYLYLGR